MLKIKEVEFNLIDKKVIETYEDGSKVIHNRLYNGTFGDFIKYIEKIEKADKENKKWEKYYLKRLGKIMENG